MKTFDNKTISKKEIERTLRSMDSTKIFALYHRICRIIPDRMHVYHFIRNYAPSQRVYRAAYKLAYSNKHAFRRNDIDTECVKRHGFYHGNLRQQVVDALKRECQNVTSNYAKRPMMGHTWLYFCSPVYGHSDYNKARMIPIKGNERFCELVIKYSDKFFGPVYDNI